MFEPVLDMANEFNESKHSDTNESTRRSISSFQRMPAALDVCRLAGSRLKPIELVHS